jgi:uncharacterized glyoxalase superfamily protein PhnB
VFDQLNLIVEDMDATLAFYRALGLGIEDDGRDWPPGSGARHVDIKLPNGTRLEFDNTPMVNMWRGNSSSSAVVIGFSVKSREAVDTLYTKLIVAGHKGVKPPHDAFWGARYAIVTDPSGNDVGLMSPIDPSKKSSMPTE